VVLGLAEAGSPCLVQLVLAESTSELASFGEEGLDLGLFDWGQGLVALSPGAPALGLLDWI
jgi:hypothetical protein